MVIAHLIKKIKILDKKIDDNAFARWRDSLLAVKHPNPLRSCKEKLSSIKFKPGDKPAGFDEWFQGFNFGDKILDGLGDYQKQVEGIIKGYSQQKAITQSRLILTQDEKEALKKLDASKIIEIVNSAIEYSYHHKNMLYSPHSRQFIVEVLMAYGLCLCDTKKDLENFDEILKKDTHFEEKKFSIHDYESQKLDIPL
jgi:hypothetical protein